MVVYCFPVGQLLANCYLVACEETKEAVVIDPGDEGSFISEKVLELGIKPKLIVATHGHFDHLLAAEELRLNFNIPFLLHQKDTFLIKKAVKETQLPPQAWEYIKNREKIKFGKEALTVIHTPGHTPGSLSLYNKKKNVLFCGDLLFKNGVGRTDFSYGSAEKLNSSLKKVFSLPPKTLVYPGHGEKFTLKEVVKYCQR